MILKLIILHFSFVLAKSNLIGDMRVGYVDKGFQKCLDDERDCGNLLDGCFKPEAGAYGLDKKVSIFQCP